MRQNLVTSTLALAARLLVVAAYVAFWVANGRGSFLDHMGEGVVRHGLFYGVPAVVAGLVIGRWWAMLLGAAPLLTLPLAGCDSGVSHGDVREITCVERPDTDTLVAMIAGTTVAIAAGVALVKFGWPWRRRGLSNRSAAPPSHS